MRESVHPGRQLLGRHDYPMRDRVFELASVVVFAAVSVRFVGRMRSAFPPLEALGVVRLCALAWSALLVADFLSGLVHFMCDNVGSADTPVVGRKFIKSFRDHHLDPEAMTRADFISVNADNFAVCLPVLIPAALWLDVDRHFATAWFLAALIGCVVITNQAHQWAHMSDPPMVARLLQRTFLLSPDSHRVHHVAPHDQNYCITSGMLNPLLTRVDFWPKLLRALRHRHLAVGDPDRLTTDR